MKLFEATFQLENEPYKTFERFVEDGIVKIKEIPIQSEVYIKDPVGKFEFIFDSNIKLSKVSQKKAKDQETFGKTTIAQEWIRSEYWDINNSRYNKNISIFYLDIETTAHSQVNTELCNERIVSIQIYHNLTNINFIFANEFFDVEKHTSKNGKYFFDDREFDFKLKYFKCEDEIEILEKFFKLLCTLKPLLVLAHNGEGFDYAYLWKRTKRLGIEERFSPFGKSEFKITELKNGIKKYGIQAPGVFYMDSIDIYKKFRLKPRESYSLDYIAEVELGEKKVNHDCFKTFDGFRTGEGFIRPQQEPKKESILEYKLYHANNDDEIKQISKEYFIHYSVIDTYLLYKIDNAIKLTNIMVSIASMMGVQLPQTLGTTTPWSTFVRNYALLENKVMPNPVENSDTDVEFKGGFVAEPKIGKYDWIFSLDVTSMYPSQIMAFNMSPETFIPFNKLPKDLQKCITELNLNEDEELHINEYLNDKSKYSELTELLNKYNLCCSMSGGCYDKSKQGILPTLVEMIFKQRKETKKEMLKYEQMAESEKDNSKKGELEAKAKELDVYQHTLKININSLFGACGNAHFLLYNKEIAKSITSNSRFYINLMGNNVNNYLKDISNSRDNNWTYSDTDSIYMKLPSKIIEKLPEDIQKSTDLLDKFIENKIQPVVNNSSKELGDIFNAFDSSKISAKREVISTKAVFIAKKRYFMRVIDSEGVRFSEPHLKTMGIDLVRSSTPEFSKKYLKKSIDIILDSNEEELKKWIRDVREKYQSQNLLSIAKTSSVSSSKYNLKTDKSIPINSRAFLITNNYIDSLKTQEFQPLELGEKVKMLYLKTPNPLNSNIFAFNNEKFAQRFKEYVDYDSNFEKFFLKPLELMIEPLNYNLYKETENLDVW